MTRRQASWTVLAATLAAIVVASPAKADIIYSFTASGSDGTLSGSFQVDSSNFPTSGYADISLFIQNYSFTYTGFGGTTYSNFSHEPEYVDSSGNFVENGPGNQFIMSGPPGGYNVVLNAFANLSQTFSVFDSTEAFRDSGTGNWTLSSAQAVPEPSTLVCTLSCVGLAGLGYLWRKRRTTS